MLPLDPKIMKDWKAFLKFIRETHNLTGDCTPDYHSIKLWQEFQDSKKRRKNENI